jgi:hypothetical protein
MESIANANGLVDGLVDGNSGIPSTFPLGMVMSLIEQTDGLHHAWHPVYRWLVSITLIVRNTDIVLINHIQQRYATDAAHAGMPGEEANGAARPAR